MKQRQEITLNISYDLSEEEWNKIRLLYLEMEEWTDSENSINGKKNVLTDLVLIKPKNI